MPCAYSTAGSARIDEARWKRSVLLEDQPVGAVEPVAALGFVERRAGRRVLAREPEAQPVRPHHAVDAGLHLLVPTDLSAMKWCQSGTDKPSGSASWSLATM
jgi:hypothetical protein